MTSNEALRRQLVAELIRAIDEPQTVIARDLGVSKPAVGKWYHAEAVPREPTLRSMATLARARGVAPELLDRFETTFRIVPAAPASPSRPGLVTMKQPAPTSFDSFIQDLRKRKDKDEGAPPNLRDLLRLVTRAVGRDGAEATT